MKNKESELKNNQFKCILPQVKRLYINREKLDLLCKLRGWVNPAAELAKRSCYKRQYWHNLITRKCPVSDHVMLEYIRICGTSFKYGSECVILFDEVNIAEPNINHPYYNNFKCNNQIPYTQYSLDGAFRELQAEDENRQ